MLTNLRTAFDEVLIRVGIDEDFRRVAGNAIAQAGG
jgi:hypothetical protein